MPAFSAPAFPPSSAEATLSAERRRRRDETARAVVASLLSGHLTTLGENQPLAPEFFNGLGKVAYRIADALESAR